MDQSTDARDVRDEDAPQAGGGDVDVTETRTEAPAAEMRSVEREEADNEIRRLGKRFNCADVADDLIELGGSVDEMREAARNIVRSRQPNSFLTERSLQVAGDSFQPAPFSGKLRGYRSEREAYSVGQWVRAHYFGDQKAARWVQENYTHVRAMSEGVASKGGFLVPDEMVNAVIDLREDRGIARQLADVVPMSSDTLSMPRLTSGATAYWTGENAALTASDLAFDNIELVAKKLTALTLLSTEVLEDAAIDLAMKVAERQAYAFADKEDEAFINGDGTSTYGGIYGLRPKIIDGTHTAGAVDAAAGVDTFAEVTADDLNTLMGVCPAYALRDAQWLISQPGKAHTFDALAQAAGGNTMMMLGDRPRPAYLGYPVAVSQVMPTSTGDLSNVAMLAFGCFPKAVTMGDRRQIRMQMLTELYAANDQIGMKATERVDIVWHELGDNSTAGPVVALIGE